MDLASGYSDSINYGNGYTPLATGAINNNNADYLRNQAAIALMAQNAQNNVFASGGGFGNQTAYYAGLGADYGRATGGFGGYGAANADPFSPVQSGYPSGNVQRGPDLANLSADPFAKPYDDSAGLNPSSAPNGGAQPYGGQLPWFWQGVRDWTGMGAAGPTPQQPAYDPGMPIYGAKDQSRIEPGNRNPVQGGPDIGSFWQGIRDLAGADPKDQSRVGDQPQQPIAYPQAGGFGASGFGPYGGSTYTGQPGFGLGIGTMGAPTQQPDISAQWDLWRMSGMQGPAPNAYQNAGMSMQERADTPYLTENQFRNTPNDLQAQDRASGEQYGVATKTSPAIDPQPYYGGHPIQFPVQPQYNPDPSPNFGNNAFPLITYEHDAPHLLDPNLLNRQQQQNLGSG